MGYEQEGRYTEEEQKQFQDLITPLCKWLQAHGHPHMKIVILPTYAELVEGVIGTTMEDGHE